MVLFTHGVEGSEDVAVIAWPSRVMITLKKEGTSTGTYVSMA